MKYVKFVMIAAYIACIDMVFTSVQGSAKSYSPNTRTFLSEQQKYEQSVLKKALEIEISILEKSRSEKLMQILKQIEETPLVGSKRDWAMAEKDRLMTEVMNYNVRIDALQVRIDALQAKRINKYVLMLCKLK